MLVASVLLVNYRSAELTLAALDHLEGLGAERPEEVVLVDNSSAEGLRRRIGSRVIYVESPQNVGFAGGVNLGLGRTTGEIVILLNPDARPEPGCLAGLVEGLRRMPEAGIAAPALRSPGADSDVHLSALRVDPGLLSALVEHTVVRRLMPGDWLRERYFLPVGDARGPLPAAAVQGACFAFRRVLVSRLGGFDQGRFFLYWEETDFCRRARAAGWGVVFFPELVCHHLGGGSTPDREAARRHFWWGLLAYQRKYYGRLRAALLRAALAAGILAEVLLLLFLRLGRPGDRKLRHDLAENRARLWEVLRLRRPERLA